MARDNFTKRTADILAKRVANKCCFPNCEQVTSGPHSDPQKATNIGVACHITAASVGGPRYDALLSASERKSIVNGIWMCQNHAKLIDSDESSFSVMQLVIWKLKTEQDAGTGFFMHSDEQSESLPEFKEETFVADFDDSGNITLPIVVNLSGSKDEFLVKEISSTWGEVFRVIGPHIGNKTFDHIIRNVLSKWANKYLDQEDKKYGYTRLDYDFWKKIEFNLKACDIITTVSMPNSGRDVTVWSMTETGKKILYKLNS